MGGGISKKYILEEQKKPLDASDIQDGDFEAAKREVERLRLIISQVNVDDIEDEKSDSKHFKESKIDMKSSSSLPEVGFEKTSVHESAEGKEYWSSLGQPPARQKPRTEKPEYGMEKTSQLESAEGAAYWSGDKAKTKEVLNEAGVAIVPEISKRECETTTLMNNLLDEVRSQIFAKTQTLEEAFLQMDQDKSGYISCKEFRTCLSKMGYFITDEEFDLINRTYPHHDYSQEKGISYLEFITMLTGKLTYVPGFGEDLRISEVDKSRAQRIEDFSRSGDLESADAWHSYLVEKRKAELKLQSTFSKKVFEGFYTMKDAFKAIDKDHSGFIDPVELKQVLHNTFGIEASDEAMEDLMERFDTNKDGKLAYYEFVKLLQVSDMLDGNKDDILDEI